MKLERAALYLQIPGDYCQAFGGLRWAHYGEAVEFLHGPGAGRTFAFAGEIALFLEGLHARSDRVVCFGAVLHLLYLVGLGERATWVEGEAATGQFLDDPSSLPFMRSIERIAAPFHELGAPLRNAGAFAGWICRDLTPDTEPFDVQSVVQLLAHGSWVPQMVLSDPHLGVTDHAEIPAFEPAKLEALARREADALSDEAIRHWLRHGCGPIISAQQAPHVQVHIAPDEFSLAHFEQRPRLTGISRLVMNLDAAVTLPPRRLRSSTDRHGGYSDLSTNGQPEQILPFQFALDEQEFLRRFAERELLYYQRDEPGLLATEEIVILLDQGVRTWGPIRIALAGAALALIRQARRRQMPLTLTTTGNNRLLIDARAVSSQALGELLESSDLSSSPVEAFAWLCEQDTESRRDLFLLTHPRSLVDPELIAATRSLNQAGATRLFAITLDAQGQLELAAIAPGRPMVLNRARISLEPQPQPTFARVPFSKRAAERTWTGDVESIPYPFRCDALEEFKRHRTSANSSARSQRCGQGKTSAATTEWAMDDPADSDFDRYRSIDFDIAGDRLIAIGHQFLYTWELDTGTAEVLPRPQIDGPVRWPWSTIIGVAGGFLLIRASEEMQYLAHYDLSTRHCKIHKVENALHPVAWSYYPDLHSIAGRPRGEGHRGLAFDLNPGLEDPETTSRASRAIARIEAGRTLDRVTVPELPKNSEYHRLENYRRVLWLDGANGTIEYRRDPGRKTAWVPLVDGHPALIGGVILCARRGGDVLALLVQGKAGRNLMFVSVSGATVLGMVESHVASSHETFALSHDGTRFARINKDARIEVTDVPGNLPPVLVTRCEELQKLSLVQAPSGLIVRGLRPNPMLLIESACAIRWDHGTLEMFHGDFDLPSNRTEKILGRWRKKAADDLPRSSIRCGGLHATCIRPNHVDVFDSDGNIVCIFYVGRAESAAWLPDGTRIGAPRLIGGEPTPGGAQRIAAVLRQAERKVQPV